LALSGELGQVVESLPQAFAKLVEAEAELKRGRALEAINRLQESQRLSDTWLSRYCLGRAYLAAKAFTQADSELDICLRRRGEATDVYLDEEQTYHVLPPVYYYLGRVREGLNSGGAAEPFRTFLSLKAPNATDPMVDDARRRGR